MADNFFRQHVHPQSLPTVIRAKWHDSVLNEGIVPYPKKVLRLGHKILKGENAIEELSVILAIVDYRREKIPRHPSPEFLAFVAGLSTERFLVLLKDLQAQGLLQFSEYEGRLKINLDGFIKKINEFSEAENVTIG